MGIEAAKGIVRVESGTTTSVELGFRPRAVVLWWCSGAGTGCAGGIGFAADSAGAASTAWAADDAVAPGVLSCWHTDAPLLFHDDPRALEPSCEGRVSFADHGFSVDCDRKPKNPWIVHYLAVGGPDAHGAAVRSLLLDGTGARAVTGLGFTPGIVLATISGRSTAGEPRSGLAVGFGAAANLSDQVAAGFVARAADGESVVRGAQCNDAVAVLPAAEPSGGISAVSRILSFERDGFTLETTHLTGELPLAVLALGGGDYAVGLGTASSRTTSVSFEPAGALLFGTGLTARPHARDIGRFCLGGFSPDRSAGCISWSVRAHGAWPLDPRARSAQEAAFEVVDTTSAELHARAVLSAVRRRGFALRWPVRDRYPREFGFAVLGAKFPEPTLRDRLRRLRGRSLRE